MTSTRFSLLMFLLFLISLPTPARAEVRTARIFDIGKTSGEPRFKQTTDIATNASGVISWDSKLTDAATGALVLTEKAQLQGGRILSQQMEQHQVGEAYELRVEGDKKRTFLTFKFADGKRGEQTDSKTIEVGDSFITGPMTEGFIDSHWTQLMNGESVDAEFGIFELAKAIDFRFKKVSDDETTMTIQMKAANFFISMLVDPLYLTFSKSTKRIIQFKGRSPIKQQVKGKWKNMDAEILYP